MINKHYSVLDKHCFVQISDRLLTIHFVFLQVLLLQFLVDHLIEVQEEDVYEYLNDNYAPDQLVSKHTTQGRYMVKEFVVRLLEEGFDLLAH